jgi:hypothetical protein
MAQTRSATERENDKELQKYRSTSSFEITDEDYHTIKIQLLALGLMAKSIKPRAPSDTNTYWTLTPLGEKVLTSLRAIPRGRMVPAHTAVVYEEEVESRNSESREQDEDRSADSGSP